jgi:Ca2+-binding RTX toxin-like protein
MQRWATQQGGFWDQQKWLSGDFNNDGRDDMANVFNDNGKTSIDVHLSNVDNSFSIARWETQAGGFWDTQKWLSGDFDGDGVADLSNIFKDQYQATIDIHTVETTTDIINAGAGNDIVTDLTGINIINLGDGNDAAISGSGNDVIDGGNGNDYITGGLGVDLLTGGAGNDSFIYNSLEDSSINNSDQIQDFEQGNDQIDLSQIAEINSINDLEITTQNGHTIIKDKDSDFAINLVGSFALEEGDFGF